MAKNMPAKVAHTYFDEKYWGTCTSLGSVSVPIGMALGYIVSVSMIIVLETFICTSILILCICFLYEPISSKLPTETAPLVERTDMNLLQSYKKLMVNLNFGRFLVLTSVSLGSVQAFESVIEEVLLAYGHTDWQASIIVTCLDATSVAYGVCAGVLLDRFNAPFVLLCSSVMLICVAMFTTAITVSSSLFYPILVGSAVLGIGCAPIWGVSLEVACRLFSNEVGGDSIVTSVLVVGVQVTCIMIVSILTVFIERSPIVVLWLFFGLNVCVCAPTLCCMNTEASHPQEKGRV